MAHKPFSIWWNNCHSSPHFRFSSSLSTYPTPVITFNGAPAPPCASEVMFYFHSRNLAMPKIVSIVLLLIPFPLSLTAKLTLSFQMAPPPAGSISMQKMSRFSHFLMLLWQQSQQQKQRRRQQQLWRQQQQQQQLQRQQQLRISAATATLLYVLVLMLCVRLVIAINKKVLICTISW